MRMLKRIVRSTPIPISGVMLSFSALDTLFQSLEHPVASYGPVKYICGSIAFLIFLVLTAKLFLCPAQVRGAMDKGNQAAILPTYSMTLMNLSVFFKPFLGSISFGIWIVAIALHLALVIRFTWHFLVKLRWDEVFISYVVGYAGIANIAITSPAYGMQPLGKLAFWLGFCCVSIVLIIALRRQIRLPEMAEADQFLFLVIASPMSVCLTGYVKAYGAGISYPLLLGLFGIATIFYVTALIQVPKFLKRSFYPSYASFTFPFVISAIGVRDILSYFTSQHIVFRMLEVLASVESLIAILLVLYTILRYIRHVRQAVRF